MLNLHVVCLCAAWCRTCDAYAATLDTVVGDFQRRGLAAAPRWVDIEDEAELLGAPSQIICMYGDMPLLRPETIRQVCEARMRYGAAIAMLTVTVDNPRGFGRVLRDPSGQITAIIEEVDCTQEQLRSRELNVGVYCFDGEWLWNALARIKPNPRKAEYFLTDTVELANKDGRPVVGKLWDALKTMGEGVGVAGRVTAPLGGGLAAG